MPPRSRVRERLRPVRSAQLDEREPSTLRRSLPAERLTDRQRAALPSDPAALPPLPGTWGSTVDAGLMELGSPLSAGTRDALDAQARLLLEWNRHINLTALRTVELIAREHVLDSLSGVPLLRAVLGEKPAVLDIGSGPGYPGLPVGLALPAGRLALVESIRKKAAFLEACAAAARAALARAGEPPPAIEVHARRVEEMATQPGQANAWDAVLARAVAPLRELAPLAVPLLRPGGVLLAWKRDDDAGALRRELRDAAPVLRRLRVRSEPRVERVHLEGLEDHRLVLIRSA